MPTEAPFFHYYHGHAGLVHFARRTLRKRCSKLYGGGISKHCIMYTCCHAVSLEGSFTMFLVTQICLIDKTTLSNTTKKERLLCTAALPNDCECIG